MNYKNKLLAAALGVAAMGMVGTATAFAQTAAPDAPATAPAAAAPSIPMYSGGVGDDDLSYIKTIQDKYNLKLLFTEADGVYVANVSVTITGKNGETVLSTLSKGPVLLLTLPAGSYKVTATEAPATTSMKVTVADKGLKSYHLAFPVKPDTVKAD